MPKSYDIAALNPSEIPDEMARTKINRNFARLVEMASREIPASIEYDLEEIVAGVVPVLEADMFDRMYPVGCAIVTTSANDPRLASGTWERIGGGEYVRMAGEGVEPMSAGGSGSVSLLPQHFPQHVHGYRPQAAQLLRIDAQASEEGLPVVGNIAVDPSTALTDPWPTSATQDPVPIEPPYIALLFYERTA